MLALVKFQNVFSYRTRTMDMAQELRRIDKCLCVLMAKIRRESKPGRQIKTNLPQKNKKKQKKGQAGRKRRLESEGTSAIK